MTAEEITSIENALDLDFPENLRDFLLALDSLPERVFQEGDVLRSSTDIIALNRRLRAAGYYHLPWMAHFLAVGSDPGDHMYYFDLSAAACPACFADHDCDDIGDYQRLADNPGEFAVYLQSMVRDWERQDEEIASRPPRS